MDSEFFADSLVNCIEKVLERPHVRHTSDLWLRFALDDLKCCIREARKEGKLTND